MTLFSKKISPFAALVIALLVFRAFLNFSVPLMDKTEARYAEIARIMAETNDYTTPQIDYGVPFWAKPPLSTWASALSFEVLGVNEFSARLPYLLFNILILFLLGRYAKEKDIDFFIPAFVLLTIPEFLIHTGVVSTDTALAFCVTLVMISFWEAIRSTEKTYLNYLFFIGLGLGLLAKGPIIFILTAPPIFVWVVFFKEFKSLWKKFNWVLGILLFAIIGIPWYYFAELKTPGFIDYFVIGEHFKRFFDSGWQGDKYGFPKSQPMGMIWLFLLAFALPWIQVVIGKLWKNKTTILKNKWLVFLLLWLLWTPAFFTISKSLIHPYIMPIMVPIALFITYWWNEIKNRKRIIIISLLFPALAFVVYSVALISGKKDYYMNSDKYFVEKYIETDIPMYHWQEKSYSGQFYSKGKTFAIVDTLQLKEEIAKNQSFYLIIPKRRLKKINLKSLEPLQKIDSNFSKNIYILKK